MLEIKCPYCGKRSQNEFSYGGDATIKRPELGSEISDKDWDNFVYNRKNPRGKHSLAVGILSKLNLIIEGSTGYFGVGLIDGPNVRINGRVGWSCGENMMSGTVLIEKNAGSGVVPYLPLPELKKKVTN